MKNLQFFYTLGFFLEGVCKRHIFIQFQAEIILLSSVADSGPGALFLPGSGIGFFRIPDLGSQIANQCFESGYGMGKKSRSLTRIRGPESFWPWIGDGKNSDPGSGLNILDPQHWKKVQKTYPEFGSRGQKALVNTAFVIYFVPKLQL
jgi:hypothetical protein